MADGKKPRKSISRVQRWISGSWPKSQFEKSLPPALREKGEEPALDQPRRSVDKGGLLLTENIGDEDAAATALASQLRTHQLLKRADAMAWLRTAGMEISTRAFQNRVWPKARTLAGLEAKAPPGRKRSVMPVKSSR